MTPAPAADEHAPAARLRAEWERLRRSGPPPGPAWCAAWSAAVDAAIVTLAGPFLAEQPAAAVAAAGGYGRRALAPNSDVDLLLLHDRMTADEQAAFVQHVVYPLWDAGLTVGYAVHDRRAAIDAAEDVVTATALIDLRPVAGDAGLPRLVRTEVLRRLRRRGPMFLAELEAQDRQRRRQHGDAAEVLEPDLKNGAGGLRDVQSLRWAAVGVVGADGLDPLIAAGYLGAPDRPRIAAAEARLTAVRTALHLVLAERDGEAATPAKTPSTSDVLRMDVQDAVAARLGIADDGAELAPHRLLRNVYLDARAVDHTHRRGWALLTADVQRGRRRRRRPTEEELDGFELVDGVLRIPQTLPLTTPDLPARLLTALTDSGAVLDRATAARLRVTAEDAAEAGATPWAFTDRIRDRLVEVLWRGDVALTPMAELDDAGVWSSWLPEWAPLRGRPQRNPYHRYALDRHSWHTATGLGELVRREPWAATTLAEVDDREALVLGALLHDVGKVIGEPHSHTGVPLAETLARRMGASEATVGRIATLTRLHLALPEAARTRDIADPALARELAGQIGDRSTLACLHLLAVADAAATGTSAWNPWTASLLHSLVRKVTAVLDEIDPDSVADGAVVTAEEAQRLAPELGADPEGVRDHLARLPGRYAAAVSPRAVVRHSLMARTRPGDAEVRTRVTPGEGEPDGVVGIDELDVVALDHPGWFATVAGVVSMHGGEIVAADAFSRSDDVAIETFKVVAPEQAAGSWWARVEGDLDDAAAGRLAVRARVMRAALAEADRVARLPAVETTVDGSPDPSGRSTVLEVRALNRRGVLYTVASTLAELRVDVVVARIQTVGHEALDVFTVRDATGGPLTADHLAEVELGVRTALELL